jgi:hypothetical protein
MARGTLASNCEKHQWTTHMEHKHTMQHLKFKQSKMKSNKTQNIMNNIHEFKNIPHAFLFFPLFPKRH